MIFVLLISAFAQASFCELGEELIKRTPDCSANSSFLIASRSCLEKLEALERKLGADVNAVAQAGADSQQGRNKAGDDSFSRAAEVLLQLSNEGRGALLELSEYPKYVVVTDLFADPNADPFENIMRRECYGGVLRRLEADRETLQRKLLRFQERRLEALNHKNTLDKSGVGYQNQGGAVLTRQRAAEPLGQGKADSKSGISGTTDPRDNQK